MGETNNPAHSQALMDLDEIIEMLPNGPRMARMGLYLQRCPRSSQNLGIELPQVDGKSRKKLTTKKALKDGLNRYCFVSQRDVLLTTTFRRVLLGNFNEETILRKIHLSKPGKKDLKSYSIIKGVPKLGLTILSISNRNIYLY